LIPDPTGQKRRQQTINTSLELLRRFGTEAEEIARMAPKISSAMMFVRLIGIAIRRLSIADWPLDNSPPDG